MQLNVKVSTNVYEGFELEDSISGFDDAEKIGLRVGRAVRDWLRAVPISKSGRRMRLEVDATWRDGQKAEHEEAAETGEERPPKRRRRKKS